jgi:hypothetical protein
MVTPCGERARGRAWGWLMTSEGLMAVVAVAALGCSGSVHDRSVGAAPLLVLHGHVDLAALERPHPDAPLLGVLVWAALPVVNPVCLQFDLPELREVCPDPYGVYLRQIQIAAPVSADGSFSLALEALPAASNSVGNEVTRITYGSLVVVEDVNRDGLATLPIGIFGLKLGAQRGAVLDVIVAATFHTLRAPQARIVLREGGFVTDSHFYPAPGCPTPPSGFSILVAPPHPVAGGPAGDCAIRAADTTVEVPPLAVSQGQVLACRGWSPAASFGEIPEQDPSYVIHRAQAGGPRPVMVRPICLNHEIQAIVVPDICPVLVVSALRGCATDPLCPQPEWDDTAMPPPGWPCP